MGKVCEKCGESLVQDPCDLEGEWVHVGVCTGQREEKSFRLNIVAKGKSLYTCLDCKKVYWGAKEAENCCKEAKKQ